MASTSPDPTTAADVPPDAGSPPARTFTEWVRSRSDAELVELLRWRPDLGTPSPSTLRSLAARASSRTSLERAVAHADARTLQALEAVLVLADGGPVDAGTVAVADACHASWTRHRASWTSRTFGAVARAVTDGTGLELVLRPGAGPCRTRLGISDLTPHHSYYVRGGRDDVINASATGDADLEIDLGGRHEVVITPR
jgi:hypothetical protein